MKRLRFSPALVHLVLDGSKDITWRIDDEKGITVGDELSLCGMDDNEFARADVVWVKLTTFGALTLEDKGGHEPFKSDQEMYATYSRYYSMDVGPSTVVKIVKFKVKSRILE